MFLIKFVNAITTGTVKLCGRISTLITILVILFAAAAYFADIYFADGYYSAYLIRNGISLDGDLFFEYSYFSEAHPAFSIAVIVGFFALVISIKILLHNLFEKKIRRQNIISSSVHLTLSVLLNIMLIAAAFYVVLNGMVITYVRSFTDGGSGLTVFKEQADFAAGRIKNDENLSAVALKKIIFDMDKDPEYISALTFEEHLKLCQEINSLMDLRGGPRSPEEHYLRNRLNYMPQNLEAMLAEIKDPSGVSWILLPPGQSAYHMFGPDGEYNLKFVSADGLFEAVYNKDGELLTEENDAINMGTYNFADPVTQPQKHSTYDVLPYYEWGNTADSKAVLATREEDDVAVAFESQEKFDDNAEAQERYVYYKSLTE